MITRTDSDGERREFYPAPEGAPFQGYMAFRDGPGRAGVRLLHDAGPGPRAALATVGEEGLDGAVIRLLFEQPPALVALTHQADVVQMEIAGSGTCMIRTLDPSGEGSYQVPALAIPDSASARAAVVADLLGRIR